MTANERRWRTEYEALRGVGMEDSQLICAYLDGLDGKPRYEFTATSAFGTKRT